MWEIISNVVNNIYHILFVLQFYAYCINQIIMYNNMANWQILKIDSTAVELCPNLFN